MFAKLDLLVVPSTPADSTPRVIIEAFSAGVPVVAFAAGGIPEIVRDGQTGFLASDFTAEALAARIRQRLRHGLWKTTENSPSKPKRRGESGTRCLASRKMSAEAIGHVSSRISIQNSPAATVARTAALARSAE